MWYNTGNKERAEADIKEITAWFLGIIIISEGISDRIEEERINEVMNIREYILLFASMASLIMGSFYDSLGYKYIQKDYVFTLIQVQSTLATIGIAALALFSSRIGHKICNIDFANFAVNLRNKVFDQLTVIIGIIISVVLDLLLFPTGKYGIILGLFLCSVELLLFEINQISIVFNSEEKNTDLIVEYLTESMKYKLKDIIHFLAATYQEDIKSWTKFKLDKYINSSLNFWRNFLNGQRSDKDLTEYGEYLIKSVEGILLCDNVEYKTKGFNYLQDIFKIYEDSNYVFNFSPYTSLKYDLYDVTKELNEDGLRELVLYMPTKVMYAGLKGKLTVDDKKSINSCLAYVPVCLRKHPVAFNSDEIIGKSLYNILNHIQYRHVPFNECNSVLTDDSKYLLDMQSDLFVNLVNNSYNDVIQKSFFNEFIARGTYSILTFDIVFCALNNLLYLYYAAYHEDIKHLIGQEITKKNSLILLKNNGEAIDSYIDHCYYHDFFTLEMLELLKANLDKYEKMAINGSKWMISNRVTEEFFLLHMVVQCFNDRDLKSRLKDIVSLDCFNYYNRFVDFSRKDAIVKQLQYILSNYNNDVTIKEETIKDSQEKYELLCRTISEIYAESELAKVREEAGTLDVESFVADIKPEIIIAVEKLLEDLNLKNDVKEENRKSITKRMCLLNFKTPTHFITKEDVMSGFMHFLDYNMCRNMLYMVQQAGLETKEIIKSSNDMMKYLQDLSKKNLLIGMNPFAYVRNYRLHDQLEKLLGRRTKLTVDNCDALVALETSNINVSINDIKIEVLTLSKKDIDEDIVEDNEKYFVTATNDIKLGYSKEDAEEYVCKKYRFVKVDCNVTLEYANECIGCIADILLDKPSK